MKTPDKIWKELNIQESDNSGHFFVTEDNKYGIYFSKIEDYRIMTFCSPVQIWKNATNPVVLFQSGKLKFEYQFSGSCYYLDKSEIVILLKPCYNAERTYYNMFYVLFDFTTNRFTLIDAPNFNLKEIEKGCIKLHLDFRYYYDEEVKKTIAKRNDEIIYLNNMEWFDLSRIDNLCALGKSYF